jgi:predicted transcriptional regulator
MKRLAELPGLSDACSERIATLLRAREPATITEIANSLAIPEYTAAVNLRQLLKKGIIGCTTPEIVPRKYFYK